MPILTM